LLIPDRNASQDFSFRDLIAAGCNSTLPELDLSTGSMTSFLILYFATACATAPTFEAVSNMPVFIARGLISDNSASSIFASIGPDIGSTPLTPRLSWTVSAAGTAMPKAPRAWKVLRSTWMPAPPEGSEPAMERTLIMRSVDSQRLAVISNAANLFVIPAPTGRDKLQRACPDFIGESIFRDKPEKANGYPLSRV
jgi:hypothetical protein